jgi:hypothetical protein
MQRSEEKFMTETATEWLTTPRPVELRAAGGVSRSVGGYAALFNSDSLDLGGFIERRHSSTRHA